MLDESSAIRELLAEKWRKERNRALTFCAIAIVLQAIATSVYWFKCGGKDRTYKNPPVAAIAMMTLPVGWLLPIVGLSYWSRRMTLRRDLTPGNLVKSRGRLVKADLIFLESPDNPEPDQCIRLDEDGTALVVPLDFWRTLPNSLNAEVEYLKHSKLIYRLNGENPWSNHPRPERRVQR